MSKLSLWMMRRPATSETEPEPVAGPDDERSIQAPVLWTRLGSAAGLVGLYCIGVNFLDPEGSGIDRIRKAATAAFFVGALLVYLLGRRSENKRTAAAPVNKPAWPHTQGGDGDAQADVGASYSSIFSFRYWTSILVLMSVCSVFVQPWSRLHKAEATPPVARAKPKPPPPVVAMAKPKPPPPAPATPVRWVPIKLQGIIIQNGEKAAILNGKTFYEGDQIEDAVLSAINRDSVVLCKGGTTNSLTLKW
jgi:hypothetical protein